eukprot:TRINITY_DN21181_c0_g1_i1.p1 TRINITY_DN21181_c0_g1~~TRINITY_DN21181_c0_g1_i1.p1  ORF type:complete len:113 (+),score=9.76 TRINITY_DN21181_c0_g1_i1:90-428(+)
MMGSVQRNPSTLQVHQTPAQSCLLMDQTTRTTGILRYMQEPGPDPRPTPIYEKHEDYSDMKTDSLGHYGTVSPRAHISQATVVNLVKTSQASPDVPPPLPPAQHHRKRKTNH